MRRRRISFLRYLSVLLLVSLRSCLTRALDTRDFYPPKWAKDGGKQFMNGSQPLGEPMNVIISGQSHPDVFSDYGFQWYVRSLGFSQECLGFHAGLSFSANLGDGNGWVPVKGVVRWDYGDALIGSCLETLVGGCHFRIARQNGPRANTSALFLAASWEEYLSREHTVSPNGYDFARDFIVARATNATTEYGGVLYHASVESVVGLMDSGDIVNHDIYIDGIVKVLTVNILEGGEYLVGTREPNPD